MTVTRLYHVGILVASVEEAVERYQDLFGLTFHAPSIVRFNRMNDPYERRVEIRAAYSVQGPPHIEIIEAVGDGLYGAQQGLGFHHVGLWDPSIDANKEMYLGSKNVQAEAQILTPAGMTFSWFSDPSSTHGVRFEFVDEKVRALMENMSDAPPHGDGPVEF
jgi:catechol 2,3-dioxygenase-like lactoylglutathione lyase family enzyme